MNSFRLRFLAILALLAAHSDASRCQMAAVQVYVFQDTSATDGTESGYADTLVFGYDPLATYCQDLSLGEVELPPRPPSGVFDARFTDEFLDTPCLGQGMKVNYHPTPCFAEYVLTLAPGDGTNKSIRLRWSPESVVTQFFSLLVTNDAGILVDMRTQDSVVFTRTQYLNKYIRIVDLCVSVPPEGELAPKKMLLLQNYPNPFNPETTIEYAVPGTHYVRLSVFNLMGQEVRRLVDGVEAPGVKQVAFDGGNLPSGVYTYRLSAGTYNEVKKMLLVR